MQKATNFCTLGFLLIVTTVFFNFTDEREVFVHDTQLDIALVIDESNTMNKTEFLRIYNGFAEWVKGYYVDDKVEVTRFAIVGCKYQQIRLYLDEIQNAALVTEKIFNVTPGGYNNFDICFPKVEREIFSDARGDRPNAPNVVLFATDCDYPNAGEDEDAKRGISSVRLSVMNTSGYFGFVCLLVYKNSTWSLPNPKRFHKTVMNWIDYDNNSLIMFTNTTELAHELDNKLPKGRWINVTDCNFTKFETTYCTNTVEKGKCQKVKYPIIIAHPNHRRSFPCPENVTEDCNCSEVGKTTKTTTQSQISSTMAESFPESNSPTESPNKVETTLQTTIQSQSSSSTVKILLESKSENPEPNSSIGPPTKVETAVETIIQSQSSSPRSKILFESSSENLVGSPEKVDKDNETTTIIIGSVVGGFLLLIVIVIVLVMVVVSRKRKENKAAKLADAKHGKVASLPERKQKEKMKGIQADIAVDSEIDLTKRSKQAKVEKSSKSPVEKSSKSSAAATPESSLKTSAKSSPDPSKRKRI